MHRKAASTVLYCPFRELSAMLWIIDEDENRSRHRSSSSAKTTAIPSASCASVCYRERKANANGNGRVVSCCVPMIAAAPKCFRKACEDAAGGHLEQVATTLP